MSLSVDDFLNAGTLRPLVEERLLAYQTKAMALLRKHFAPFARPVPDADLRRFVAESHARAKARGIVSEREQLHYLTIAFQWGIGFDTDPQYRAALRRAMWLDEDDRPMQVSDTLLLRGEIPAWQDSIAPDLANSANIRDRLFELYRRGVAEPGYPRALRLLQDSFPTRFRATPQQDWIGFCDSVHARIDRLALEVVDVYCCVALAVHFGHDFMNDPRYPWAGEALANDGRSLEARRIAFGEAIVSYWDGLTSERV